jgi:hypothetical protein
MRIRGVEESCAAHAGSLGEVASGGGGRYTHFRLPIFIIPMAPRSDLRFRAGTIAFAPRFGLRDRGDRAGFREPEGSDHRTGPTFSTTNPT